MTEALLHAQAKQVEARSVPFARVLHQALMLEAQRLLSQYARGALSKAKGDTMPALLARYGVRTARDAFGRATVIATRNTNARLPPIRDFEGYERGIETRGDDVRAETEAAFKREIQRIIEEAQKKDVTPTQAEISRQLRSNLTSGEGFDGAFTFERASRIARTELAIAENTGLVQGYKESGVEELEWLGFRSPVWPRRHDLMIGERIKVGGRFTLPSGAKLRYPCDPSGPVGEIIHCRCSVAPVLNKKPKPAFTETRLTEPEADEDSPPMRLTASVPGVGKTEFVQQRRHRLDGQVIASLSAQEVDELWSKDEAFHIPAGGGGAEIGGRRESFQTFLESTDKPIETSSINFDAARGRITFNDGRHRFSVLRDLGMKKIPVSIDPAELEALKAFLRST